MKWFFMGLAFTGLYLQMACVSEPEITMNEDAIPTAVFQQNPGMIINELMFNPPLGGADYIEVKNAGSTSVNLNNVFLCSMNEDGSIAKKYKMSEQSLFLAPGEYRVFTTNKKWVIRTYECDSNRVMGMGSIPTMNNSSGWVALADAQNVFFDQVQYREDMHFSYLNQYKGVALERVDDHFVSDWNGTWHSASFLSGFGTPTKKNSQARNVQKGAGYGVSVRSELLTPNMDGRDDLLWIDYNFPQAGQIAHMDVFRLDGSPMGNLWNGILLGTSGSYAWDGCLQGKRVPCGDYILCVKHFSLQGKSSQAKMLVKVRW